MTDIAVMIERLIQATVDYARATENIVYSIERLRAIANGADIREDQTQELRAAAAALEQMAWEIEKLSHFMKTQAEEVCIEMMAQTERFAELEAGRDEWRQTAERHYQEIHKLEAERDAAKNERRDSARGAVTCIRDLEAEIDIHAREINAQAREIGTLKGINDDLQQRLEAELGRLNKRIAELEAERIERIMANGELALQVTDYRDRYRGTCKRIAELEAERDHWRDKATGYHEDTGF